VYISYINCGLKIFLSAIIKFELHNCFSQTREKVMTAQVKVLLHAMFKESAGKGEISHELSSSSNLKTLLEELADKYGKEFRKVLDPKTGLIETDTLVMLNGKSMRRPDALLKDGDVVMITIPIGGG
jgi:MoaD family protein